MYYMKTHYELMALDIQTLKKNEYKNELSVGPSACDITHKGLNYFLLNHYYFHKKVYCIFAKFYSTQGGEKSK